MAVRHSGWTGCLASSAAQATADVRLNRFVVRRDSPFEKRPHEKDSSPRTVVLILEREIGWARLKTESAVHARVDSRELSSERGIGERAGRSSVRRNWICFRRDGGQLAGPRIPGFKIIIGSNARRTFCDTRSAIALGESLLQSSAGADSSITV
jgi:hypothetical protein